jgi:hypothetical protein
MKEEQTNKEQLLKAMQDMQNLNKKLYDLTYSLEPMSGNSKIYEIEKELQKASKNITRITKETNIKMKELDKKGDD